MIHILYDGPKGPAIATVVPEGEISEAEAIAFAVSEEFRTSARIVTREEADESLPPIDLVAYASRKRWEKETGGIEVAGLPVHTDDRSKMMIMGARIKADANPDFTTQWKTAGGSFFKLDAAMLIAVSDAVLEHVGTCFAIEESVLAGIAAEEITSTEQIDAAFD